MTEKETYRFRNSKRSYSVGPHPLFWVGQRVARSWERRNFIDVVAQVGVVTALPTDGYGTLTVEVDGVEKKWSHSECKPVKVHYEIQRKRLASVAKDFANLRDSLDENGFPIPEEGN